MSRGAWRWEEMRQFHVDARVDNPRFLAVGSSDYHGFSTLGVCRTLVFVVETAHAGGIGEDGRDATERAVLAALRAGRTVVHDLEGRSYGDPALIELLAQAISAR